MKSIEFATALMSLYAKNNQSLYLVGGSVRDYLLTGDFTDFDFATPVLLDNSIRLLGIHDYDRFSAKFGTLKTNYCGRNIEITTFRKESGYSDYRHPDALEFVTSLEVDASRRDFTINAMYLDYLGNLMDPYHGQQDLQAKRLVCIGNSDQRLQEDPVRILRAIRFALRFQLTLDSDLEKSLLTYGYLVREISESRGRMELQKMRKFHSIQTIQQAFDFYKIDIHVADYVV